MVGQRRSLLDYLRRKTLNATEYCYPVGPAQVKSGNPLLSLWAELFRKRACPLIGLLIFPIAIPLKQA